MTNWQQISSPDNRRFKQWKQLLETHGIRKQQRFLLSGFRTLEETLAQHADQVDEIIISRSGRKTAEKLLAHTDSDISVFELSATLYKQINAIGSDAPFAVCRMPPIKQWDAKNVRGLHLLCPLGDPTNMGNLVRTAAALGVDCFVLLQEACSPFHMKAVRAASGTLWEVTFAHGPSIYALPPCQGVALHTSGENLYAFEWPKNCALLVGEEGPGLPENLTNWQHVSIPVRPNIESLNAATAAALALFSYRKQIPF